jgi:hypothetical protein
MGMSDFVKIFDMCWGMSSEKGDGFDVWMRLSGSFQGYGTVSNGYLFIAAYS